MQIFKKELVEYRYFLVYCMYSLTHFMAKKPTPKSKQKDNKNDISRPQSEPMNPRTKRSIIAIVIIVISLLIVLGAFGSAGIAGDFLYNTILVSLFGFGAILVPIALLIYAVGLLQKEPVRWTWLEYTSSFLLILSILGFIDIVAPGLRDGGIVGHGIGTLATDIFASLAGGIILGTIALVSIIILLNEEIDLATFVEKLFAKREHVEDLDEMRLMIDDEEVVDEVADPLPAQIIEPKKLDYPLHQSQPEEPVVQKTKPKDEEEFIMASAAVSETYEYPPLSLLGKSSGKPSVGDIKANANLIKRTLLNFGIDVEMDEVSIGPTVTRYALKPAEGIKLSRIVALKPDLALALAAHPIRIEAPIPGKSLVGIEIPNKTMANVGLGSLLEEDAFQESPFRLQAALGKTVTGKSYFANLAKMPHLLIAGTTGSGKSVTVHNLILSFIYKNGPEDLRLILIDPKRVELTLYNEIPHLLTPVIKEPKKAILALKWAAKEMERRYDLLEKFGCRDIQSYHKNILEGYLAKKKHDSDEKAPERMPYIVIIIDELADIMQAYPRELESAIVRLAQMSRAVGIHLVLSTQRPSVNVITGLIKANIPSRIALKVASQIDSRTILDAPGAESLLGKGDMLYQGEGMSKPERMQCGNVDEDQINAVVSFIKKHNVSIPDEITLGENIDDDRAMVTANVDNDDEDELYEDARAVVMEAGKASTSYIQRKLKVGYSRAARLIDLLEERGVVGPADGAKPREILSDGGGSPSFDLPPTAGDELMNDL